MIDFEPTTGGAMEKSIRELLNLESSLEVESEANLNEE
jgi:hypothetical protein